ncbi:hypothetical protein ACFL1X_00510, partial [Candidatus Hydrogenedentota bacterium]
FYEGHGENMGGLTVLESRDVAPTIDRMRFRIMGLSRAESRHYEGLREKLESWLEEMDEEEFTIIMGHAPDYILDVAELPIDLCLAGHTHGGQVRIPFCGPLITGSSVPGDMVRGFHSVGNTRLNVSAGMGSEHADGIPAIRVNCPTEMTLIELVPL